MSQTRPDPLPDALPTALLVLSDLLGPEPEVGAILMRSFLATLAQAPARPARALFLNRGVYLTTEGSALLEVLSELERGGTEILSCGTCLEFFGLRDRLRAGRVSNMHETVETLTGGHRVVTLG